MSDPTCSTCHFSRPISQEEGDVINEFCSDYEPRRWGPLVLTCRHDTPRVVTAQHAFWPITYAGEWCGKHKPASQGEIS